MTRTIDPLVAVVVLNFNGWNDTRECLQSLLKSRWNKWFAIVVDNGSATPGLKELVRDFPEAVVLALKANVGFARAMNIGTAEALARGAEWVVLINNDTLVDCNFLAEVAAFGRNNSNIGAVCPLILWYADSKTSVINFAGGTVSRIRGEGFRSRLGKSAEGLDTRPYRTEFATGCCMARSAESVRRWGGFDEDFFFGVEDIEFSWRVKDGGGELWVLPTAVVWHKEGRSRRRSLEEIQSAYQAKVLLQRKRRSRIGFGAWLVGFSAYMWVVGLKRTWKRLRGQGYTGFSRRELSEAVRTALFRGWTGTLDTRISGQKAGVQSRQEGTGAST